MMMFYAEGKKLRASLFVCALVVAAATASLLPVTSVQAQTRTLPDFTDLVDQVGPSVVNIRTIEKVAQRAGNGEMDEEMQEFFRLLPARPARPVLRVPHRARRVAHPSLIGRSSRSLKKSDHVVWARASS
jgi:serine protease Do